MGNISPDKIIKEYYIFHKKIESIINSGYNPFSGDIKIEKLYILDKDFIDTWRVNSGYNITKYYFDELEVNKNFSNNIQIICDKLNNNNILHSVPLNYNKKLL